MPPIIPGLSHCSASPQFSSTGQFSSSAEGYNSVYDSSDYYNYNNYPGKSLHIQSTASKSDLYVDLHNSDIDTMTLCGGKVVLGISAKWKVDVGC